MAANFYGMKHNRAGTVGAFDGCGLNVEAAMTPSSRWSLFCFVSHLCILRSALSAGVFR